MIQKRPKYSNSRRASYLPHCRLFSCSNGVQHIFQKSWTCTLSGYLQSFITKIFLGYFDENWLHDTRFVLTNCSTSNSIRQVPRLHIRLKMTVCTHYSKELLRNLREKSWSDRYRNFSAWKNGRRRCSDALSNYVMSGKKYQVILKASAQLKASMIIENISKYHRIKVYAKNCGVGTHCHAKSA